MVHLMPVSSSSPCSVTSSMGSAGSSSTHEEAPPVPPKLLEPDDSLYDVPVPSARVQEGNWSGATYFILFVLLTYFCHSYYLLSPGCGCDYSWRFTV